jgi:hypothetical protein
VGLGPKPCPVKRLKPFAHHFFRQPQLERIRKGVVLVAVPRFIGAHDLDHINQAHL